MILARVIEFDGAPMLVIIPKKNGTHQHDDIIGITNIGLGDGTCRRYEGESMPKSEMAALAWLTNKVTELTGCAITYQIWSSKDGYTIKLTDVIRPGSQENPQPATSAA